MNEERARYTPTVDRPRRRLPTAMAVILALALLFPALPVAQAIPSRIPVAQQETAGSGQVIAQGVSRLTRGEIAWAISRLDLADDELAIETWPVGFVLADGATVALLDEDGETLNLLQDGEAAFLPAGRPGALASATADATSAYQIALLPAADATAAGVIAGNPFPAPEGQRFDLELSRYELAAGEEAVIPASRSGAPVLLLQTAGTSELQAADQALTLDPGGYAQLTGETVIRGASEAPAMFVVAAIGEPAAARSDRERTRAGAGQAEQAASAASGGQRERRARRARTGGRGGQAAPQPAGGGTAPITGGPSATVPAEPPPVTEPGAGTPEPTAEIPQDGGTPPPEATVPVTETPTETLTPTPVVETPTATAPPVESPTATAPIVETPTTEAPQDPVETPVIETPVVETPVVETPVVETPVTEDPAAEAIAPDAAAEQPVVAEPLVETPITEGAVP